MINRVFPSLEVAVEVLKNLGYTQVRPRVWVKSLQEGKTELLLDEVTVTPLSLTYPIRTKVRSV